MMKTDKVNKKSRTIRIAVTDEEFDRIQEFTHQLRSVGRITISKTDATAAILLAAMDSDDMAGNIRDFIRHNFQD